MPDVEPVVDPVQPGAEQENQVAEEIACEKEGGPGFRSGELGITLPQHNRTHLVISK
jgi:hypothetical protein